MRVRSRLQPPKGRGRWAGIDSSRPQSHLMPFDRTAPRPRSRSSPRGAAPPDAPAPGSSTCARPTRCATPPPPRRHRCPRRVRHGRGGGDGVVSSPRPYPPARGTSHSSSTTANDATTTPSSSSGRPGGAATHNHVEAAADPWTRPTLGPKRVSASTSAASTHPRRGPRKAPVAPADTAGELLPSQVVANTRRSRTWTAHGLSRSPCSLFSSSPWFATSAFFIGRATAPGDRTVKVQHCSGIWGSGCSTAFRYRFALLRSLSRAWKKRSTEVEWIASAIADGRRLPDATPSETTRHSVGHPRDRAARHRGRWLRRLRLQEGGAATAAPTAGARADLSRPSAPAAP